MAENLTAVNYKQVILSVMQNWEKLGLPPIDQNKLSFQALPFRKSGPNSLLNFMITAENRPVLVIRGPRFKEGTFAKQGLENEAVILSDLGQNQALNGLVPKIYKSLLIEQSPILLVQAYQGRMLHEAIDKETEPTALKTLIMSGAETLRQLHLGSRSDKMVLDDQYIKGESALTEPLVRRHLPDLADRMKTELAAYLLAGKLGASELPKVCFHQEYNPWNLMLQENGQVMVFDWEDALREGPPMLDVYNYFLIAMRIIVAGESQASKALPLPVQQRRLEALLQSYKEFSRQYCQDLGIPEAELDPLFLLFGLRSVAFFLSEKRQEVEYAKHWLPLLFDLKGQDLFSRHLQKEAESHWRRNYQ